MTLQELLDEINETVPSWVEIDREWGRVFAAVERQRYIWGWFTDGAVKIAN